MARRVRFIPEGGALVEITTRTIQGRHLLTPGPAVNEVILGVLGRAQRLHTIPCCGICVLSSHYHLLLRVQDAETMADFMEYVNSNLAREVGRIVDCRGCRSSEPFRSRRSAFRDIRKMETGRLSSSRARRVREGASRQPLPQGRRGSRLPANRIQDAFPGLRGHSSGAEYALAWLVARLPAGRLSRAFNFPLAPKRDSRCLHDHICSRVSPRSQGAQ